ncbi:hypothetical protein [Eisenibacter elegans]|jgi:hypothetical protein|uniref:hypothetical protein n=1 Tax=Eisenibacter elegans TaxID=997 RepID=UPI00047E19A9|nr:hypothetical protein [Eisenibacter elegans]
MHHFSNIRTSLFGLAACLGLWACGNTQSAQEPSDFLGTEVVLHEEIPENPEKVTDIPVNLPELPQPSAPNEALYKGTLNGQTLVQLFLVTQDDDRYSGALLLGKEKLKVEGQRKGQTLTLSVAIDDQKTALMTLNTKEENWEGTYQLPDEEALPLQLSPIK